MLFKDIGGVWHHSRRLQGQDVNATTELEKVLKALSSDPDALLLMGRLLPHVTTGVPAQQRLDLLKDGAMHHIMDADIQVRCLDSPSANLRLSAILRAVCAQHARLLRSKLMQEVLGDVLAVAEPGSSASAFLRALERQKQLHAAGTGSGASARLLNNTGVLQYRSKRYNEALELMQKALDQLQRQGLIFSSTC